jgi:hypothetical protein
MVNKAVESTKENIRINNQFSMWNIYLLSSHPSIILATRIIEWDWKMKMKNVNLLDAALVVV